MEQKRTLWIIAASGAFLLVVVGAALILSSPSVHKNQTAQVAFNPADGWTTPSYTTTTAPADTFTPNANDVFAQNDISVPDFTETTAPVSPFEQPAAETTAVAKTDAPQNQPIQAGNVTVYADNTTVYGTGTTTTIDLNALKSTPAPSVTANNAVTANQIASVEAAKATAQPRHEEPKASANNAVAVAPKPAPSAPTASTSAKAPAKTSPAPAKTAKETAAKTTAAVATAKVPDRFWVQAAAYSTKKNADDARATLESNKIPSEVFTYTDSKGKVFYRVRIGPYTTSSEAEYWKTQVAKIDQFSDAQSYVVNSSAKAVH